MNLSKFLIAPNGVRGLINMQQATLLTVTLSCSIQMANAQEFVSATLSDRGAKLVLSQSDGTTFDAPRFDDQDGFAAPGVSQNHRYAGWLALYPNRGASYSQALGLTVIDVSGHLHRFSGDFGMLLGWCFAESDDAVVYRFALPHGNTATGFQMRRVKDGKLLRRFLRAPVDPDADETQGMRAKVPAWTHCARSDATSP